MGWERAAERVGEQEREIYRERVTQKWEREKGKNPWKAFSWFRRQTFQLSGSSFIEPTPSIGLGGRLSSNFQDKLNALILSLLNSIPPPHISLSLSHSCPTKPGSAQCFCFLEEVDLIWSWDLKRSMQKVHVPLWVNLLHYFLECIIQACYTVAAAKYRKPSWWKNYYRLYEYTS